MLFFVLFFFISKLNSLLCGIAFALGLVVERDCLSHAVVG